VIGFARTVTVTARFADDEATVRFRGLLEDHIYAMDLEVDVRLADGVITAIGGTVKRFTTPWCRDAEPVLQRAVGMSLRADGWISRVNRDLGRHGCEHLAALLVECGRCLDTVRLARAVAEGVREDPSRQAADVAASWIEAHPEAWKLTPAQGS
jgi:hypothetical protein